MNLSSTARQIVFWLLIIAGAVLLYKLVNPRGSTYDNVDLVKMMQTLADFEINEVLVEAGGKLNGSLIHAGLVDELVVYLAPYLIGGAARNMLNLPELRDLAEKRPLKIYDLRTVGPDIRVIARFS